MTALRALAQLAIPGVNDPALLEQAIRAGLAERGGYLPARFSASIPICPPESQPILPESAAAVLKRMLTGEHKDLLPELLQRAAVGGFILPPETLPALLDVQEPGLRALILPVLGARGAWLAAQNQDWGWALPRDPRQAWETGTRAERLAALKAIRAERPAEARKWVQEEWQRESPEDRAAFVSAFSIGLSPDDEPFLEACLDDRRKEVREAAQMLLLRLPQSRLVERMWARAHPLVRAGATLEVTLPEEADSAAKRDGLNGAPLRKGMGAGANRLAQLMACVPPVRWSQALRRSPATLITLAQESEWHEPLLVGWALAACRTQDADWAAAVLQQAAASVKIHNLLEAETRQSLAMLLEPEQMQAIVETACAQHLQDEASPLWEILQQYTRPWTPALAWRVIQEMQQQAHEPRHRLPHLLPSFARRIPPEMSDELAVGWPEQTSALWQAKIDEFLQILNLRKQIWHSLEKPHDHPVA